MVKVAECQRRGRRLRSRSVGFEVPGRPGALDGGVGVGVEDGGPSGLGAVVEDLQRSAGRGGRVVAQGDGAADQQRIDFVDAAVEADGAVVDDAALGLEQEQIVQFAGVLGVVDLCGAQRPLIERGVAVQAAMGVLNPRWDTKPSIVSSAPT